METQKLFIAESSNTISNISASQASCQFARQHLGVATGNHNLAGIIRLDTEECFLEIGNLLYLIDKQIVFLTLNDVGCYLSFQILIVGYHIKRGFLLIYIDNVVVLILSDMI